MTTGRDRRRALGGVLYGADYNPEQWPADVWPQDMTLMRQAGVTCVSVGVFAWARIQPTEQTFDFAWLDQVLDLLHDAGIGANLATATASPPPWVSNRYPEILPCDDSGARYWPGSRQHFAPSSPRYRELAAGLVSRIAQRYARHPAVVMWHVGNEFGCHLPMDFSDAARDAFRDWLRAAYGSIDALNDAWGTAFWSQSYHDFDEVFPPRKAPYSRNPSAMLDFRRFTSDMWLQCYLMERQILHDAGAVQPITTNLLGPFKPANYAQWAPHLDVIADDCYPDPADPHALPHAAFQRDLIRSLKPGVPWLLMEQATDAVNWRTFNLGKRPGRLAAETAQCIGRGADGIMFFQWRQSRAGSEKFHSAMLPHAGTGTRTWQDAVALGATIAALPALPPPGRDARVALVFDWENWWAVEERDHPTTLNYLELVHRWYRALHRRHLMVDIVAAERVDADYDLVIAPQLYLLRETGATALASFVESGGTLLATAFSDVVDEHDRFLPGGFLTRLGPLLGIRLTDFGVLVPPGSPGVGEQVAPFTDRRGTAAGTLLAEEIEVVDAEVLAVFSGGAPAMTSRHVGAGRALYLATIPDEAGTQHVVDGLIELTGVQPVVDNLPACVEAARRGDLVTIVNHGDVPVTVTVDGTDVLTHTAADGLVLPPDGFAFIRTAPSAEMS
ncbi:beta-galactosidase [Catellatospora sp. KI3]|uniref:beta-galactosidase n=1 Tax=Catellatospora sp. KI3 TaxID=3041620 RepID=UPI0024828793|nr:beta-galactosidase [Catellatospora sp. KI3]MDI1460846.1 beta-galactosidase [Catellatospora sp. KI3]